MTNLLFGCVMVSEPGHRGLLYRLTGQQQIMRRSCTDLTRRVRRHGSCPAAQRLALGLTVPCRPLQPRLPECRVCHSSRRVIV